MRLTAPVQIDRLTGKALRLIGRLIVAVREELDPAEILRRHPDVEDAIMVELEMDGARIHVAAVSVVDYCSPPLLREHVNSALGGVGRAVDGVLVLPERPAGGAVDPAEIRRLVRERADEVVFATARGPVEERLAELWETVLDLPRVGAGDDFLELGGDSLSAARLLALLDEEWGITVDVFEFMEASSVRGLAGLLRQKGVDDTGSERPVAGPGGPVE